MDGCIFKHPGLVSSSAAHGPNLSEDTDSEAGTRSFPLSDRLRSPGPITYSDGLLLQAPAQAVAGPRQPRTVDGLEAMGRRHRSPLLLCAAR